MSPGWSRHLVGVLGTGLLVVALGASVSGQSPSPGSSPSASAAPSPSASPVTVQVGRGQVLVGSMGSRDDVVPTADELTAAADRLQDRAVGFIVSPGAYSEALVEGASAVLGPVGALVAQCSQQLDPLATDLTAVARACWANLRQGRSRSVAIVDTIGLPFPARQVRRAIEAGIPVIRVGAPASTVAGDGTILVSFDDAMLGRALGLAAGGHAAEQWPGVPLEVLVMGVAPGQPDAFADALEAALLEADPALQLIGRSTNIADAAGVNMVTGRGAPLPDPSVADAVATGAIGVPDEPFVLFPLYCPQPMPADGEAPWFGGCLQSGAADLGATLADIVIILAGGGSVPAFVEAPAVPITRP